MAASPTAPSIIIGNQVAPCQPDPVVINSEVFVPATFRYAGLPVSVTTEGNTVILSGPGDIQTRVPGVLQQEQLYYPIARACAGIRLGARWMERTQKLTIAPRVDSIRPEMHDRMLTLTITAGYPINCEAQVMENPARLVVEIPNAQLFSESTAIPIWKAGIRRIRASQYSHEPSVVRLVVDVDGTPQYRVMNNEATTRIRVRVGVPASTSPEAESALDELLDSPDPDGRPVDVTGVEVQRDEEGNTQVVVRTTGPSRGQIARLDTPPRIALDIPNASVRCDPPQVPSDEQLIQKIRLGQFTQTIARVVVDLAEHAECTLTPGPDPGTLVLTLRAALGLAPVHGINGLRVMLDPGHGGSLNGTTGLSGRREQDINLDVAKRVYQLLEQAGASPSMTRQGDDTVGLHARPAMANAQGVHLFISIHCNSNGVPNSARGIETFYCSSQSLRLAQTIHHRLVVDLEAPDRKVRYRPGLVVTRETKMPSILVEIGYMNHREEDALLGTPEYRQRVAKAIFDGIVDYTRGRGALESPPASGESNTGRRIENTALAGEEQL